MLHHLPILIVIAPLLVAPFCILSRRFLSVRLLALATTFLVLLMTAVMLEQAVRGVVWQYAIGGWPAPWGIAYRVDLLGALVALLIGLVATVVVLFAGSRIVSDFTAHAGYFFALFLLCLAGLLGITVTNDLFNIFVFLEIAALSSYALVALGRGGRPALAAYRYLMMGSVGATLFLIGVGYLYMMTGTLNLSDLAQRLPEVATRRTVSAAFALIAVGLAMKMALFPLHWWLPDTYRFAPSPVTALFAAVSAKVAIYLIVRLFFGVFGIEVAVQGIGFDTLLMTLSLIAIVFASGVAIYQDNIKRMMAYSSISQIGYITLGISLVSVSGVSAGVIHLFNHALIKGGLFIALGCISYRLGGCRIGDFAGLGRRMPWTMAALVIGGLSLVGVPLTAGFIGKWQLISALFEGGLWPLIIGVLAGSLLTTVYVWRLFEAAYLRPAQSASDTSARCEVPPALLVPVWILVVVNLYIGFNSEQLVEVATQATRSLIEGGL